MTTPPRAYVSRVLPRPAGDGYYFRTDLPNFGRISNRYRWSEAVVDRAATIVSLAKRGFEVIYETGPGEQSGRLPGPELKTRTMVREDD